MGGPLSCGIPQDLKPMFAVEAVVVGSIDCCCGCHPPLGSQAWLGRWPAPEAWFIGNVNVFLILGTAPLYGDLLETGTN